MRIDVRSGMFASAASHRSGLSLPAIIALLLIALTGPLTARAEEPPGLVIDVLGGATLAGKGRLAILEGLAPGAEISLAPGARATVLDSSSGRQFELIGPGAFRWTKGTVEVVRPGKVVARAPGNDSMKEVRLRTARIAQASISMRGGEESRPVKLAFPVSTWLLERPAVFRWEPVTGAKTYRFQLTDSSGHPLHEARTAGASVELPAAVALEAGHTYGWQVWAELADGRTPDGWTEFGLAGPDLRARVERNRPPASAPFSDRLLYALLLEELGVREDATRLWVQLASERPEDPDLGVRARAPH
jgi:hypothetical protein